VKNDIKGIRISFQFYIFFLSKEEKILY